MRMDQSYAICTDTGADIPWRTAQQQKIEVAHLHYRINEAAYIYDLGRETDLAAFYATMRNETPVSTIPVLAEAFCAMWNPILSAGRDILYLSLSGGMSKTFYAAQQAREQMRLLYPLRRMILVDTCSCSIAQGMLVFEAASMRRDGHRIDEVAAWVVENRQYIHGVFLPESRKGLKQKGLYTGNALGELLGRSMVFRLDLQGLLQQEGSFKSTEEALNHMVEYVIRRGYALKEQVLGIVHTDAPELAGALRGMLLARTGCADTMVMPMGPISGCYAYPGAVGVAFFGSRR